MLSLSQKGLSGLTVHPVSNMNSYRDINVELLFTNLSFNFVYDISECCGRDAVFQPRQSTSTEAYGCFGNWCRGRTFNRRSVYELLMEES